MTDVLAAHCQQTFIEHMIVCVAEATKAGDGAYHAQGQPSFSESLLPAHLDRQHLEESHQSRVQAQETKAKVLELTVPVTF